MRIFIALTGLLIGYAAPAVACEPVVSDAFALDPDSDDAVPPSAPGEIAASVSRGEGETCTAEGSYLDSCSIFGWLNLSFAAAIDDRSPPEPDTGEYLYGPPGIGYQLRLVEGDLPDDFALPADPRGAFLDDGVATVRLVWIDGTVEQQDPFSAVIGVRAVDLAGNESEEVTVAVSHDGVSTREDACDTAESADEATVDGWPCGCRAAGSEGSAAILLALGLLAPRRAAGGKG